MPSSGKSPYIHVGTQRALQLISHQNNEGVTLYNQGKYAEAVKVFKEATSTSKKLLGRPLEEVSSTDNGDVLCTSLQVLPSQTACDNDVNVSTVYWKPFEVVFTLVSCKSVLANCKSRLFLSRLSAIMIFNMALTHHAIAMMSSEDNDSTTNREFLSKARHLYNLAYSIPQGEQEQEVIDEAMLPLFVKAVLNNLGHCFSSLGDINNSVACYELLLRSIMLFQQDRHIQYRTSRESKESFPKDHSTACFLDNTLFLILKDPCGAPAA
ncbi:expressed tetratricopeptide repeat protein [Nitzschia inconspicua]|uniref:Expressed tetratricopeptide repeat protein n=1 Tax=Nitzschia inconspicua TaxID=303405 RepID=A0A9K3KH54_9STRA|nr:expressed tetratricopeptide repeat protein [Nitzschia inconspicua]